MDTVAGLSALNQLPVVVNAAKVRSKQPHLWQKACCQKQRRDQGLIAIRVLLASMIGDVCPNSLGAQDVCRMCSMTKRAGHTDHPLTAGKAAACIGWLQGCCCYASDVSTGPSSATGKRTRVRARAAWYDVHGPIARELANGDLPDAVEQMQQQMYGYGGGYDSPQECAVEAWDGGFGAILDPELQLRKRRQQLQDNEQKAVGGAGNRYPFCAGLLHAA
eukprot:1158819-Pelagomonas_calceolata.AAC.5